MMSPVTSISASEVGCAVQLQVSVAAIGETGAITNQTTRGPHILRTVEEILLDWRSREGKPERLNSLITFFNLWIEHPLSITKDLSTFAPCAVSVCLATPSIGTIIFVSAVNASLCTCDPPVNEL